MFSKTSLSCLKTVLTHIVICFLFTALHCSWICLAAFLRETLKRVIVDEMRVGAADPRQRYMIFAVMLAQGFWLYILS